MKLFTHLAFIILAAFITACSSDEKESAELVEMHFRAVMPDSNLSKSVGSGNLVNVLYVEAISNTGKKVRYEFPVTSGYVDARISLAKGLIYDIIFWAQRKENNPYDNRDLTAIKMNLPTAMTNVLAMEQYDAFYATLRNIPAEDKAVTDVELTRPLAQVNVAHTRDDARNVKLNLDSIPTIFKPLEDKLTNEENIEINFEPCRQKITLDSLTYNHLAMMYIFATPTDYNTRFALDIIINDDSKVSIGNSLSVKANHRTNIINSL
jgi:hypothetical protein